MSLLKIRCLGNRSSDCPSFSPSFLFPMRNQRCAFFCVGDAVVVCSLPSPCPVAECVVTPSASAVTLGPYSEPTVSTRSPYIPSPLGLGLIVASMRGMRDRPRKYRISIFSPATAKRLDTAAQALRNSIDRQAVQ